MRFLIEAYQELYEAGDLVSEVLSYISENFGSHYALTGGAAMLVHAKGARQVSPDIDIFIIDNGTTRTALKDATFSVPHKLNTNTLGVSWDFSNGFNVDFLYAKDELEKDAVKTAKTVGSVKVRNWTLKNVRVIGIYYLFLIKFLAGRDKDIKDMQHLYNTGKVNKQVCLDLAAGYLGDADLEDLEGEIDLIDLGAVA